MPEAVTAYLALGSNLGDREANLQQALRLLGSHPQMSGVRCSGLYETEPVGDSEQGWFLNAAARLETTLSASELLMVCLEIERQLGRIRDEARKNGPRTLDLDILFYGDQILNTPTLSIPHPRLPERAFVLAPLAELAPDFIHPGLGRSIQSLLEALPPAEQVRPLAHKPVR